MDSSSRLRSPVLHSSRRQHAPMALSLSVTTARASPPAPTLTYGSMAEQEQFLQVLDRDEVERRFRAALILIQCAIESAPLDVTHGRTHAEYVISPVDVPSFDRANVDGFAVVAEDTYGASEEVPRKIRLVGEHIHTGIIPTTTLQPGTA